MCSADAVPKGANGSPFRTNNFPKSCRLHGRTAFKEVLRAGRKITGSTLAIYYTGGRPTRFGIGVSKKQGGAVDRNRLKRTVREFLRQNRAIWPVDKWVLIRFERRSPGSQRPESRLEFIDELERLLKKIR